MLLQIAFAAANHRLRPQIEAMSNALPHLVSDERDLALCQAFLLCGAGDHSAALNCLQSYAEDTEADMLRQLICTAPVDTPATQFSF
jgi:type III secretion system SsaH family protein